MGAQPPNLVIFTGPHKGGLGLCTTRGGGENMGKKTRGKEVIKKKGNVAIPQNGPSKKRHGWQPVWPINSGAWGGEKKMEKPKGSWGTSDGSGAEQPASV